MFRAIVTLPLVSVYVCMCARSRMLSLWGQLRIHCQAVLPLQHQAEQACSAVGVPREGLNPESPRVFPLSGLRVFVCPLFVSSTCVCISAAQLLLSSWLSSWHGQQRQHKGGFSPPALPCLGRVSVWFSLWSCLPVQQQSLSDRTTAPDPPLRCPDVRSPSTPCF